MTHYCPILATLGFILSEDRKHTLLVHRNKRKNDEHFGKYNGLGGKLLPGEDIVSGIRREILEEAGIHSVNINLRGTINWTNFGRNGEDWFGFIFRIDSFTGPPFKENKEGILSWQPIEHLSQLPMWPGDRYFLPLVFDDHPGAFHGYMPYKNGLPLSWSYERL